MWTHRLGAVLIALLLSAPASAATIEIDIQGLTCAFCVDSLQRQLKELPDIVQVDVSLKSKKVRIVSRGEHIDVELIREVVINAGFTPVAVRPVEDDS